MPSSAAHLDGERLASFVAELKAAHLPEPAERRQIREQAGVSFRELAQLVGVTPMQVLRWERGQAVPTRGNAAAYRQVLDALRTLDPTPATGGGDAA